MTLVDEFFVSGASFAYYQRWVESFVSHFDELHAGVKSKKTLFQHHFSWIMVIANDVNGSKMLHSKFVFIFPKIRNEIFAKI